MKINRNIKSITLDQKCYLKNVLKKYEINGSFLTELVLYREVIGCSFYDENGTCFDLRAVLNLIQTYITKKKFDENYKIRGK